MKLKKKNNMISKLRFKLVAVSMGVTLAVLILIVGGMNIVNYNKIVNDADKTIEYLAENYSSGEPVMRRRGFFRNGGFPGFSSEISPEAKFDSRYFVVSFDEEGKVASKDTGNIMALTDEESEEYAKAVYAGGSTKGFYDGYRYAIVELDGNKSVMFLDCFRSISNMRFFLFISVLVSFLGWLTVFVIVLIFSKKIVEPVSKSYEKQKRFITDAGHEIKTPLAIIEADVGVLEMESGENEWLGDIKIQTGRLAKLTNDLIQLSKLDEGKGNMTFTDFQVSDLAAKIINSFLSLATINEKKLAGSIEPNLVLNGDKDGVAELFNILLDNAIKYSEGEGNIRFELKKKGGHIAVEVINAVEHITKEEAEKLFDRFYRMDSSRNSETGGHGIGLSMAKAIVNAHGGKIKAEAVGDKELRISAVF